MWDEKFEGIVRRHLPFLAEDESLGAGTELRDGGLDSLAMVELLSTLEEAYEVRLTEEALTLETFQTAGTLWNALATSLPASAG